VRVTISFPNLQHIDWEFADGNVPRRGELIDFADPDAPNSLLRVVDVTWFVTERGCSQALVRVGLAPPP